MGQLDTIVGWTKKLESVLETRLGAEGRGLHEKTGSVEHRLDKDLVRLLRKIATRRNKAIHEDGYTVEDIDRFVKDCEYAHNRIVRLETAKTGSQTLLNTLKVNEPPAWMKVCKESDGSGFWMLAVREVVELVAPITWVVSPKKLFVEAKRIFFYVLAVLGGFAFFEWMVTGVYAAWGTLFLAILAVLLIPASQVYWLLSCISSGKYNEY